MLRHVDPGCDRNRWIAVAGALKNAVVVNDDGSEDDEFDGLDTFTDGAPASSRPTVTSPQTMTAQTIASAIGTR